MLFLYKFAQIAYETFMSDLRKLGIGGNMKYFSKREIGLWAVSVTVIFVSFMLFDRGSYLTLTASLIGVTSLIFNAKGNPIGQILMVAFSVFYGVISYSFRYYGEMATYLGMTAPMAIVALIAWVRHPYNGNRGEVKVHSLCRREVWIMLVLTVVVTGSFYFILKALGTANLVVSTISVTTSFLAVWLTFLRSEYFALAYGANDVVLIVLWVMASRTDPQYISVVVCFFMFLINDLYGFYNWQRMKVRQK